MLDDVKNIIQKIFSRPPRMPRHGTGHDRFRQTSQHGIGSFGIDHRDPVESHAAHDQ